MNSRPDFNPFELNGKNSIFKSLLVFIFIMIPILAYYLILSESSNLFPIKEVYIDGDLKYLDQSICEFRKMETSESELLHH